MKSKTMGHAIQCPPTPGPGFKIFTRGCKLQRFINSQTFRFISSHIIESSLQKQYLDL